MNCEFLIKTKRKWNQRKSSDESRKKNDEMLALTVAGGMLLSFSYEAFPVNYAAFLNPSAKRFQPT